MTNVYVEMEGGRCLLVLNGHATGSSEVCAAISCLVYALAGYITNAERDGVVEIYSMDMAAGKVRLHFHGDGRATAAFEMAIIGLRQLEKQYPDLIRMDFLED